MALNNENNNPADGSLTIFNIEKKVDSANKVATVSGLPHNNFWWANEANLQNEQLVQAAIDAINVNFSWSSKPNEIKSTVDVEKIHLLFVQLDNSEIFQNATVNLCIKRYKHARTERTATIGGNTGLTPIYKSSGFKNFAPSASRPSKILLTGTNQVVDYQFENFFSIGEGNYDAMGLRKQNKTRSSAYIYIQFHLEVSIGLNLVKKYYSKPLRTIKVRCSQDNLTKENRLSFKM